MASNTATTPQQVTQQGVPSMYPYYGTPMATPASTNASYWTYWQQYAQQQAGVSNNPQQSTTSAVAPTMYAQYPYVQAQQTQQPASTATSVPQQSQPTTSAITQNSSAVPAPSAGTSNMASMYQYYPQQYYQQLYWYQQQAAAAATTASGPNPASTTTDAARIAQLQQQQQAVLQQQAMLSAQRTYRPQFVPITPKPVVPKPTQTETPKPDSSKESSNWPPSLRSFVERTFESCKSDTHRNLVEKKLKDIITNAIKDNSLWKKNWAEEQIPTVEVPVTTTTVTPTPPPVAHKKDNTQPKHESRKRLAEFAPSAEEDDRKKRRKMRFVNMDEEPPPRKFWVDVKSERRPPAVSPPTFESEESWAKTAVIGTSKALEKKYLRLTESIDPASIRPRSILKQSRKALIAKMANNPHLEYLYICEQLKCIRQDLMIQHIKDKFTVKVYEMHARLALQHDDMGEFNQCQMQLVDLYKESARGGHEAEFSAYRLLFTVVQKRHYDITRTMREIPFALEKDPAVQHAIAVQSAVILNDYIQFFRLRSKVPNLGVYLLNKLVPELRTSAVRVILKAYRPCVPVELVQRNLGFEDTVSTVQYLTSIHAVLDKGDTVIQTKESLRALDVNPMSSPAET